jgi:hypothetical protein
MKACNIMAEGVAPYYVLQNYGTNRNCTLTASFPAVISIEGIEVGGTKGKVNYDVRLICIFVELISQHFVVPSSAINITFWTKSPWAAQMV